MFSAKSGTCVCQTQRPRIFMCFLLQLISLLLFLSLSDVPGLTQLGLGDPRETGVRGRGWRPQWQCKFSLVYYWPLTPFFQVRSCLTSLGLIFPIFNLRMTHVYEEHMRYWLSRFLSSRNCSGWLRGEESSCQYRRHGFNPPSRKIPRAARAREPRLLHAATTEAHVS